MRPRQPTLHMLCGYICAGKSTLAKKLGELPETVVISEDRWMAQLFGAEISSMQDYNNYAIRFRAMLAPHTIDLLRAGLSVVLDMPANSPEIRRAMRAIAERGGALHQLHYLDVPAEVCRARLAVRNQTKAHEFQLNGAAYQKTFEYRIAPAASEGFEVTHYNHTV